MSSVSVRFTNLFEQARKQIAAHVKRQLQKCASECENQARINLMSAPFHSHGRSSTGNYPAAITGRLHQSVFNGMLNDTTAFFGIPEIDTHTRGLIKYGRYLEYGAFSHPKSRKFITIPVSEQARKWLQDGGSARDFPVKLTRIKTRSGTILLVEMAPRPKGTRAQFKVHFILAKRAVLFPRHFLNNTLLEMIPRIREIMSEPMT